MLIKKIYEKIKSFITENYLYILFLLVFYTVFSYPLPYYIYTGGGLINVDDKIIIDNKTESKGSYNLCYVAELRATIPTYLLSYVVPGWDMLSHEEVAFNENEDAKDINTRNKVLLDDGNNSAIIASYSLAGKEYKIINLSPIIIYILEDGENDFKIGDEILSIDNINIKTIDDITDILNTKNFNDIVKVKVLNNSKEYIRTAKVINHEDKKMLGISIANKYDIETNPNVSFDFSSSESGPSGGFMMSLALYDYLVDEDLTKGRKISGTGTIDKDGNVGEIDGVKYKLKGAVSKNSDIFFVPNGDNYKEAIKLKKKKDYDIEVIGVSTLEEAIEYLRK